MDFDKISLLDLFDFGDNQPLRETAATLEALIRTYKELDKVVKKGGVDVSVSMKKMQKEAKALDEQLRKLSVTTEQDQKAALSLSQTIGEQSQAYKSLKQQMEANTALSKQLKDKTKELEGAKVKLLAADKALSVQSKKTAKDYSIQSGSLLDLKKRLKEAEERYVKLGHVTDTAVKKEALERMTSLAKRVKDADNALRAAKGGVDVAAGSYNELSREVRDLNARVRSMPDAYGKNSEALRALQKEIYTKTQRLKEFDAALNQNFRNVGNYSSALGFMKGSLKDVALQLASAYVSFEAVSRAMRFTIETQIQYEKELSSLSSITGATGAELDYLSEQALLVGESSTKSATEAVQAFKLIGSAKPELLANSEALAEVTKQAVLLAEAGEVGLPEAAQAITSALNQFSLPASDAARVINALAAGAEAGAAEIPDLTASIDTFGGVAAGANVSLEQSVALVELLSEKNLKGAEAGTQLRNVILQLEKANYGMVDGQFNLSAALDEVNAKGLSTGEMMKLFGVQNIQAARAVLENTDKLKELETAVTGTDKAYSQAATNTNNLAGDIQRLKNAAEAAALSQEGLGLALRKGVQFLTAFIRAVMVAPKFIKENKDIITAMSGALVVLNFQQAATTAAALRTAAAKKIETVSNYANAISWKAINTAMKANPILAIVSLLILLGGALYTLYTRSETVRAGVAGLMNVFAEIGNYIKNNVVGLFSGLGKLIEGALTLDPKLMKEGLKESMKTAFNLSGVGAVVNIVKDGGKSVAKAFTDGYNEKLESEMVKGAKNAAKKAAEEAAKGGKGKGGKEDVPLTPEQIEANKKAAKAEYELQKFRLEMQVKALDEQAQNEELSMRQREVAAREAALRRIQIAQLEAKDMLANEELLSAERKKIVEETAAKINEIETNLRNLLKLDKLDSITITIDTKATEKSLESFNDQTEKSIKDWKDKWDEAEEARTAKAEEEAETRKAIEQELMNFGLTLVDAAFAYNAQRNQEAIESLQMQKEAELAVAGDNAAAKEEIERKYNARVLEMKKKQAKADKFQAIFDIALNTAVAFTKALASSPPPANFILAGLVGAMGAVQAALVASKPLPQYFKGTNYSQEGPAWVAEKGPELVVTPKGELEYVQEKQIKYLQRGSKVKTAEQTKRILEGAKEQHNRLSIAKSYSEQATLITTNTNSSDTKLINMLSTKLDRIERATRSKKQTIVNVSGEVQSTTERNGSNFTTYINSKYFSK